MTGPVLEELLLHTGVYANPLKSKKDSGPVYMKKRCHVEELPSSPSHLVIVYRGLYRKSCLPTEAKIDHPPGFKHALYI